MKMRLAVPATLALALSSLACSEPEAPGVPAEDATPATITLTVLWSSPGDEDLGFLPNVMVGGMVEVGDEVWVGNGRAGHLLALDREGNAVRAIGRRGEGPGEFQSISRLARTPDGGVAVHDVSISAIHRFDAAGEFVERIGPVPRLFNTKGFVADARGFVFSGGIEGNEHAIHRVGPEGSLLESWHPLPVATDPDLPPAVARDNEVYVAGGPIDVTDSGALLFSQSAPHRVLLFTPGDTTGRLVAEDPDLLDPAVDTFTTVVDGAPVTYDWLFPQSRGVYQLADGRILNVVTLHEDGRSLWQLYEPSGEPVAQLDHPRAYYPWHLTSRDTVLVSYEDPVDGNALVGEVRIDLE